MVIRRGEVWWADLPEQEGSRLGEHRPVLIIQSNAFNIMPLRTVLVASITRNLKLADSVGNVFLPANLTRLPSDSVLNVTQVFTLNRVDLTERVSKLPSELMAQVNQGLKAVLSLR